MQIVVKLWTNVCLNIILLDVVNNTSDISNTWILYLFDLKKSRH